MGNASGRVQPGAFPASFLCDTCTLLLPIDIGDAACADTHIFPEADRKQEADYGCNALALQLYAVALAHFDLGAVCRKRPLSFARHDGVQPRHVDLE